MAAASRISRRSKANELYLFDSNLVAANLDHMQAQNTRPIAAAGMDEAGRGAIAGPVIVACVSFPSFFENVRVSNTASSTDPPLANPSLCSEPLARQQEAFLGSVQTIINQLEGLDDSKRLTANTRERLFSQIARVANYTVGCATANEIDRVGIVTSCNLACQRAYKKMEQVVDILILDRGLSIEDTVAMNKPHSFSPRLPTQQEQTTPISTNKDCSASNIDPTEPSQPPNPLVFSFTRADSQSFHVAASSIIAKVTRDRMMQIAGRCLGGYGFATHKGYSTSSHRQAVSGLGPSPIHRHSFNLS